MKKMYAFLIIAAAMTTPSCNDSKKSDTAETEKKPETACDCVGKANQVLKDFTKMTVKEISTIGPDPGAYMEKKMNEGNDCKNIMEKAGNEIQDCKQFKEFISLQKEFEDMFGGSQNSSQPEVDMQNEDAGYAGESGDMAMPEDMEMPDMPEPEMPEDF